MLALAKSATRTPSSLIADEIQTGFARTGKLFTMEHSAHEADVVVLAKGLAGGAAAQRSSAAPMSWTRQTPAARRPSRRQPHHLLLRHAPSMLSGYALRMKISAITLRSIGNVARWAAGSASPSRLPIWIPSRATCAALVPCARSTSSRTRPAATSPEITSALLKSASDRGLILLLLLSPEPPATFVSASSLR